MNVLARTTGVSPNKTVLRTVSPNAFHQTCLVTGSVQRDTLSADLSASPTITSLGTRRAEINVFPSITPVTAPVSRDIQLVATDASKTSGEAPTLTVTALANGTSNHAKGRVENQSNRIITGPFSKIFF